MQTCTRLLPPSSIEAALPAWQHRQRSSLGRAVRQAQGGVHDQTVPLLRLQQWPCSSADPRPPRQSRRKWPGRPTIPVPGLQGRHRHRPAIQEGLRLRRAHPAVRGRTRAPVAGKGQSRRHLADGHRHLLRAGGRVRVRRQGLGAAAGAADHGGHRLQWAGHRCRRRHRRQGDQGHQGQTPGCGRGIARADAGCAGADRLRRPERAGRHARAVRLQQRHVERLHQQRGRRRPDLDAVRPIQRGCLLAARHRMARPAGHRQGGLGTRPQEGALLRAAQGDLRRGRPVGTVTRWPCRTTPIRYS